MADRGGPNCISETISAKRRRTQATASPTNLRHEFHPGAQSMSDDSFIREVDDEMRQDRLRALWERYGKLLIAVAVATL